MTAVTGPALPPGIWWIEEPWLAGGANPDDAALAALRDLGFAAIVSLLDPREQRVDYDASAAGALGFRCFELAINDYMPPSMAQCEGFVNLLADLERSGDRVLVHCQGGKGRTGTMAAVFLVSRGRDADEAIARVRRAREGAIETPSQEAAIRDFARGSRRGRPAEVKASAEP